MKTAFENAKGELFELNRELLDQGIEASRKSPRKRMVLPVHREQEAVVQRLYNFLQPGTYIRPHLHPRKFASESMFLLQGSICLFLFDDEGKIREYRYLEAGSANCMVDIIANVWHSFIVLEPDTVLFEVKRGPYDTELDKTFAEWAPEEFSREAGQLLSKWEKQYSNKNQNPE